MTTFVRKTNNQDWVNAEDINELQEAIEDFGFNVKSYGAVGDGVTDDTAAIQAAIADASSGGVILFPTGTYSISETIAIPPGVILRGVHGSGGSALDNPPKLVWVGDDSGTMFTVGPSETVRRYRFHIDGLLFVGAVNSTPATDRAHTIFRFDDRMDTCHFSRCEIQNVAGYGMNFTQGGINVWFDNGRLDGCAGAAIRWVVSGSDLLTIAESSIDSKAIHVDPAQAGIHVLVDGTEADDGHRLMINLIGVQAENNEDYLDGTGAITLQGRPDQHQLELYVAGSIWTRGGETRNTMFVADPPTDKVEMMFHRSLVAEIEGVPSITGVPASGYFGWTPFLAISPHSGSTQVAPAVEQRRSTIIGEFGAQEYFRHGLRSSVLTHATTSSLPAGVTLWPGDTIIDPATVESGHRVYREVSAIGTIGTLSGITGSGSTGTAVLTVNDASDLRIGQYIVIGGTDTRRIIGVDEEEITLSANMSTDFTDATVAWSPPSLREYPGAPLRGSATWNPSEIADGDSASTTVTVTGAALGDYAQASFSLSLSGMTLSAYVSATNTVTVVLTNTTGSAVNLAEGTVKAKVTSV